MILGNSRLLRKVGKYKEGYTASRATKPFYVFLAVPVSNLTGTADLPALLAGEV
jgi:hypothetical protein